jgi:hypothetical protein
MSGALVALRGHCVLRRGQDVPSFPRAPFLAAGILPTLRSGQVFLDEAEHFLHNRVASVARLRWCSGSSRNAVRLPSGTSVQLHRNPQFRQFPRETKERAPRVEFKNGRGTHDCRQESRSLPSKELADRQRSDDSELQMLSHLAARRIDAALSSSTSASGQLARVTFEPRSRTRGT